jgi:hypothetical protein
MGKWGANDPQSGILRAAPSDYALEASLERKKSIPALLFIDQEPESRCQAQTQIIRCE